MTGLFAIQVALAAEPVVLPEFSFDDSSNFALSVMLQGQLADALTNQGHIVLDHGMVVREVGTESVDRCVEQSGCPQSILPRLPSQVAVVARIAREQGELIGHVEIWEQSRTSAMEVRDFMIKPGEEERFVTEVASATSALIARLPPSPPEVLMAAARMVAGQPANGAVPAPQPSQPVAPQPVAPQPAPPGVIQPPPPFQVTQPQPQPAYPQPAYPQPGYPQPTGPQQPYYPAPAQPQPPAPQPILPTGPAPVAGGNPNLVDYSVVSVEEAIQGTPVQRRHLLGARQNLIKSGLNPRTWMFKRTPHSGRVLVEPRVGIGIGDVARGADVRIAIIDGVQQREVDWFQEGPLFSQGVRGELFVGFAPHTVIDIGVLGGLQYGGRRFSSGIYAEANGNGQLTLGGEIVSAVQFVLQPRLRAYIVPFGPVKPYVWAGGDFRFFDGWNVSDAPGATFLKPPGGMVPGIAGGGGIMVDPSPIFGIFVEGGYIRHFGTRASAAQPNGRWTYDRPEPPTGISATIPIVGGVQFRL